MAEFGLRPPGAFNFDDSEQDSKWDSWKNQFKWFLQATKKDKDDKAVRVSVLITCMGIEVAKIYGFLCVYLSSWQTQNQTCARSV